MICWVLYEFILDTTFESSIIFITEENMIKNADNFIAEDLSKIINIKNAQISNNPKVQQIALEIQNRNRINEIVSYSQSYSERHSEYEKR